VPYERRCDAVHLATSSNTRTSATVHCLLEASGKETTFDAGASPRDRLDPAKEAKVGCDPYRRAKVHRGVICEGGFRCRNLRGPPAHIPNTPRVHPRASCLATAAARKPCPWPRLYVRGRGGEGRRGGATGENCTRGGDVRVSLTASRRGRPAPPRVVTRCAAVAVEAAPRCVNVEADSCRHCHRRGRAASPLKPIRAAIAAIASNSSG
jgi:hypothetical protein